MHTSLINIEQKSLGLRLASAMRFRAQSNKFWGSGAQGPMWASKLEAIAVSGPSFLYIGNL